MTSSEYKHQFLDFLRTAFPQGIPEGVNCLSLLTVQEDKNLKHKFSFRFDVEDFNKFIGKGKKAKRIKKETTFDSILTQPDIEFLKKLNVSVEDVKESHS